jgi:hypothetical protein
MLAGVGKNVEEAWPVQRLRIGWSLVLFFFFETLIGKQLPLAIPYLSLVAGAGLLVSAMVAIRALHE